MGLKKWVVEYSYNQDCFNITTLEDVLETNKSIFINRQSNDYQILDICDDMNLAYELARKYRNEIGYKK